MQVSRSLLSCVRITPLRFAAIHLTGFETEASIVVTFGFRFVAAQSQYAPGAFFYSEE